MNKLYKVLFISILSLLLFSFGCKKNEKTETKAQTETPQEITNPKTETKTPTNPITPTEPVETITKEINFEDIQNLLERISGDLTSYEFVFELTRDEKIVYYNKINASKESDKFQMVSYTKVLNPIDETTESEYSEFNDSYTKDLDSKVIDIEIKEEYFENPELVPKCEKAQFTPPGIIAFASYEYDEAYFTISLNQDNLINSILMEYFYDGLYYRINITVNY